MLLRGGFALAILVSAVFVLVYTSGGERNAAQTSKLSVALDPEDSERVVFRWDGGIRPPMARELSKAFENWRDKSSRIVIDLNSPGGSVDEGDRVISLIGRMKQTHRIVTYVGRDSDCLSMCVPIYIQGDFRIASSHSRWLFHDVGATDPYVGTRIVMTAGERNRGNFDFFNRYIDRSDVAPEWRDRLASEMQMGDVWKTGRELKDERSNIVMVLED